jgi:hypothetical protein
MAWTGTSHHYDLRLEKAMGDGEWRSWKRDTTKNTTWKVQRVPVLDQNQVQKQVITLITTMAIIFSLGKGICLTAYMLLDIST